MVFCLCLTKWDCVRYAVQKLSVAEGWVRWPVFGRVIKSVPHLDLHNNVPLGRPAQQVLEPPPGFVVPPFEVEFAVLTLEEVGNCAQNCA